MKMVNGITTNSQIFNMVSENQISNILEHFNSQYIFDTIKYSLQYKMNCNILGCNPNIVQSFESTFNYMSTTSPSDSQNIKGIREETYKEILDILCKEYNMEFLQDQSVPVDYYTAAFYMYDMLVSKFSLYAVKFFSSYIYKERNELYSALHLEDLKRNKDSSTIYGKKMYCDPKLAVINANIDLVIRNILSYDITLYDIINIVFYPNADIANFLCSILRPIGDFYKVSYGQIVNHVEYPVVLTNIRLEIQQIIKNSEIKGE